MTPKFTFYLQTSLSVQTRISDIAFIYLKAPQQQHEELIYFSCQAFSTLFLSQSLSIPSVHFSPRPKSQNLQDKWILGRSFYNESVRQT